MKKIIVLFFIFGSLFLLKSCEDFFDPDQKLVIDTEDFFRDWSEFRSAEMGLYALQQELVDQIIILGELRGDLLEITENAERDLQEIYNFQITRDNKFAAPTTFYRLIGACNNLLNTLEISHPEVLGNEEPTDYDRLYGEVKCMRAWAYFNAVRIYGKVPYIWPGLTTVEEITAYVNSEGEYIDSVHIDFDLGGYYNDTSYMRTVVLSRQFLDLEMVIDTFTVELENEIKAGAVGVIHNKENQDPTWNITVWNKYAYECLLGQMYLYRGDYVNAQLHFDAIIKNYDSETSYIKYGLDGKFSSSKWKSIFSGMDGYEHIYTLWFGKTYQQQHNLQNYFSLVSPNSYMLKPTKVAVHNWETLWDDMRISRNDEDPELATMKEFGEPGDFSRGHGISYVYMRGVQQMDNQDVRLMLEYKKNKKFKDLNDLMAGVDTVVYKYTYGKQPYDQGANIVIYRAGGIHLYSAEIYNRWEWDHGDQVIPEVNQALGIVNDGSYEGDEDQLGVRGRVGFGGGQYQDDGIQFGNIIYINDPFTNELTGYLELPDLTSKQDYLEDQIIEERARELAYEGERFYDLIRIAKRRNDPSYLADKVARKFSGAKQDEIRSLLMNEENWYIPFFE